MNAKVDTKPKQPVDAAKVAPVADVAKVNTETGETAAPVSGKKQREYKTMNGVEYINKITAKSVMGDKFMETKPEVQEDMFRLIGLVQKAELNTKSQYGDSFKFKGTFKAVRLHDGVEFTSGSLYLPHALEDIVASQIQSAQSEGDEDVQFVVDIGRKPSKKGQTGYEYTFKPVLQVVQYDPLQALENAAKSAGLPVLPNYTKEQLASFKN
jgi:hypothetical protein